MFQQTFSSQAVTSLAWTPDNKYVLYPVGRTAPGSLASSWIIEVRDSQTHQVAGHILDPANPSGLDATLSLVYNMASSPDGNQIALNYQDTLWVGNLNLSNPHSLHQLVRFTDQVYFHADCLIWSPNGQYLAVLSQYNLSIWDASNGHSIPLNSTDVQGYIKTFAWAANSTSVTIIDYNNAVSLWSVG